MMTRYWLRFFSEAGAQILGSEFIFAKLTVNGLLLQ
jgi:hypothetical protein